MSWSNTDPRDTFIDQSKTIIVSTGSAMHLTFEARVDTLGIADGASTDRWEVAFPGRTHLEVTADDPWPDHYYWTLLPERY